MPSAWAARPPHDGWVSGWNCVWRLRKEKAGDQLHEPEALRAGRWEAFVAKPTLPRLLDLWETAAPGAERAALLPRAVAYLRDYLDHSPGRPGEWLSVGDGLEQPAWIGPAVLAHAGLLAGDWDAAQRLAAQGQVLGWSSSENAQGLVVAASLVLLSGRAPGALPANLAQSPQLRQGRFHLCGLCRSG